MTINIDENIIERAVREAVADHLEKHPLTISSTEPTTGTSCQQTGPRYYTRQQAAEVAQISIPTLHALRNEGLVEFVKIGRSTRIYADKFDADLAAGKFSNTRHRRA